MNGLGSFHHVGVACRRIEDEAPSAAMLGYAAEGPVIEDPIQKVRLQFYVGAGPRIELIEPLGPDSPVQGILKRGTRLYHFAYEVFDLQVAIDRLSTRSFRAIAPPAPAVAFQMRPIVFMLSDTLLLVELIEAAK